MKLDTNGSRPDVVKALVGAGLVDYIAMDMKGPLASYDRWCGCGVDKGKIRESIDFILEGRVDYEFRMTLVPFLHREQDALQAAAESDLPGGSSCRSSSRERHSTRNTRACSPSRLKKCAPSGKRSPVSCKMPLSVVAYTSDESYAGLAARLKERFEDRKIKPYTLSFPHKQPTGDVRFRATELAPGALMPLLADIVEKKAGTLASPADGEVRRAAYGEILAGRRQVEENPYRPIRHAGDNPGHGGARPFSRHPCRLSEVRGGMGRIFRRPSAPARCRGSGLRARGRLRDSPAQPPLSGRAARAGSRWRWRKGAPKRRSAF